MFAALVCASLDFTDGRLSRFNVELLAVLIYCALVSAALGARMKSSLASVLYSSLVAGWIIAVGFFHY